MRALDEPAGVVVERPTDGRFAEFEPPLSEIGASDVNLNDPGGQVLRRDSLFRRALAVADMVAVALALTMSAVLFGDDTLALGTVAIPLVFVSIAKVIGLYDRDEYLLHRTTLDEFPALFGAAATSTLLIWLADGLVIEGALGRRQILGTWILLLILLIGLRAFARWLTRNFVTVERCLFVGDGASAEELREKLATAHAVKAELVGWLPVVAGRRESDDPDSGAGLPGQIRALVAERQVERVVLGPGVPEQTLDEVRRMKGGVKVSILPEIRRVVTSSAELDRLNGIALLGMRPFEITWSSRAIKRCFDVLGSVVVLLLAAPVMALIALAIRIDSSGPALFRQRRAGRHGEAFSMLKFRSMVDGADELKPGLRHLNEADGVFKIANDPRITRVGKFIRRTHLDELPQLFNVLKGDMSLVGPRPLPLDEDRQIEGWHRRRLDLSPGITGPWQILGSARVPVREMVKLDYQYVANWSLWNDVRILILTVGRVARRTGV